MSCGVLGEERLKGGGKGQGRGLFEGAPKPLDDGKGSLCQVTLVSMRILSDNEFSGLEKLSLRGLSLRLTVQKKGKRREPGRDSEKPKCPRGLVEECGNIRESSGRGIQPVRVPVKKVRERKMEKVGKSGVKGAKLVAGRSRTRWNLEGGVHTQKTRDGKEGSPRSSGGKG